MKDKHIQKIQTQYTEHWIKNRTTQNKKNRTDLPKTLTNSYYYYLTARNTNTHTSTKNSETKYGTLKKYKYILKKQGRPSCPKLLPLEIQTHEEEKKA